MPRVFQTKAFRRLAIKEGVREDELCRAAADLQQGKGDPLGGNVWKKRLNENRSRAIVAAKPDSFWVFMYVFSKSDRENIGSVEQAAFRRLAAEYCRVGITGIEKLAAAGSMLEICHEPAKQGGAPLDVGGLRARASKAKAAGRSDGGRS